MVPDSSLDYAGDVSAQDAWDRLAADPKAQMIDVRTMAEWNFVGVPDLSQLKRPLHCIEWQGFPGGGRNPVFAAEAQAALARAGAHKNDTVLLLCRSGARSAAAAVALTQAGFEKAFNVAGGFEGDADSKGHRGMVNGWKASNLPWRQG